jgi:hypothetical protein
MGAFNMAPSTRQSTSQGFRPRLTQ